jgi:hypothetical protein
MPFRSSFLLALGLVSEAPSVITEDSVDLQVWYDFSDSGTVNTTGGNVISVDGKGYASVHDANTSGAPDRPSYTTASQNSLNTAQFNGLGNYFTVNPFTNFDDSAAAGITGYTMFAACKFNTTANQRLSETDATGNSDLGFGIDSAGKFEYHVGGGTVQGSTADTNWHVHSFVFNGSRSDGTELTAMVDGANVLQTETSPVGDAALTNTNVVYIGASETPSLYFSGELGEIIVFTRALTASEVSTVNTYLANKWGITLTGSSYVPPEYVSSGLTAYYDPANTASYAGSGSTLTDLSGNGINGTIVGATHTSNTYFTLDGVNDYIVTGNCFSAISASDTHTVEMWVYANATSDSLWSDLGTTNDPATSTYHFAGSQILQVGPFQQIITGLWNGSAITRDVANSGTLTGAWQHVTRTYDGTTLRGYLNGVNGGGGTAMTFDSPADDGETSWFLAFGAQDTTTYSGSTAGWLSGRVGIMRVYNRALSGAEVLANYNNSKSIYGL